MSSNGFTTTREFFQFEGQRRHLLELEVCRKGNNSTIKDLNKVMLESFQISLRRETWCEVWRTIDLHINQYSIFQELVYKTFSLPKIVVRSAMTNNRYVVF